MDRSKTLSLAREAHERGDYASASALYSRLDGTASETDARHFALAEGYAWGRQDERVHSAGAGYERDTAAATAFAQAFAAHRDAFLAGKLGMAYNVGTAYDMFVRGEALPTDNPPKRLGDMSPAERQQVTKRAAALLQAELEANAPAIARILEGD